VPDWNADSPELRANLTRVTNEVARASGQREKPTLESARQWQQDIISGLAVPDSRYVGRFVVNLLAIAYQFYDLMSLVVLIKIFHITSATRRCLRPRDTHVRVDS
jgi:hypothetical protein